MRRASFRDWRLSFINAVAWVDDAAIGEPLLSLREIGPDGRLGFGLLVTAVEVIRWDEIEAE